MLRNMFLLVLCMLTVCGTAAVAKEFFDAKPIFVSGVDGMANYRIPAVIVSSKGTIIAFCEARKESSRDKSPTDLVLKRSFDNGIIWQKMQTVYEGDSAAIMNPTPVVDRKDGTIWLGCNYVRKSKKIDRFWILNSTDDGQTWSKPIDITDKVGPVHPGPAAGIQLKNGRLIIPGRSTDNKSASLVIYSDDHGKTWEAGDQLIDNTNECQAIELADGELMLNCRSTRGKKCRFVGISKDGGQTWSEKYDDPQLPEPVCQGTIERLSKKEDGFNKNRILFANPARQDHRSTGTVKLSYDEGKTWPIAKVICPESYAYSCLAVQSDRTIACLYETKGYGQIVYCRFNLQWLTDGKDELQQNKSK